MGSYLAFAFTGFLLIVAFLEKLGRKEEPDKPCLQVGRVSVDILLTTLELEQVADDISRFYNNS